MVFFWFWRFFHLVLSVFNNPYLIHMHVLSKLIQCFFIIDLEQVADDFLESWYNVSLGQSIILYILKVSLVDSRTCLTNFYVSLHQLSIFVIILYLIFALSAFVKRRPQTWTLIEPPLDQVNDLLWIYEELNPSSVLLLTYLTII